MKKIKEILDLILRYATIVIFSISTVLVIYQVLARYILNKPSSWTESAITYSFIWLVMLCGAYVFGQKEHMNMAVIRNKFNRKIQIFLEFICELFTEFLAVVPMIVGGYNGAAGQMNQIEPSLKMPMGVVYSVIPFAGACIVFYCLYNQVTLINEIKMISKSKKGF